MLKFIIAYLLLLSFTSCTRVQNGKGDAAIEQKIEALLSRMTLEEKIGQMNQISSYGNIEDMSGLIKKGEVGSILNEVDPVRVNALQRVAMEESRLGIPLLMARDVIHGFKTIFPIPLGQAASFNPQVAGDGARVAAVEASAVGIRWTFAPMIDVARDPRWGRMAEGCGEDTYLTSVMGAAMVKGFQGDSLNNPTSIAACPKHFVGYGAAEGGRDYNSTFIPERRLRNVYLPPFEAAAKAGAATFMTSFNDNDGVPSTGNTFILKDVLRGEWGFEGLIMTDWNGGSSTPWKSMHAGNDLIMPGGKGRAMNILQAVRTVMPEFDERGQVIMVQEVPFAPVFAARWNSFTVDPEGPDTVMAPLGEGHTAEMKDGEILVDGEKVYMQANDMKTFFNDPASFVPKICPANEEVAFILDDGRAIGYKGHLDKKPRLCLGDVQRCAVHNLRIILKCMGL